MCPDRQSPEITAEPQNGKAAVRISVDGMEAFLTVTSPRNGGLAVSLPEALSALTKAGVTFGLDMAAIEQQVGEAAGPSQFDSAKKPGVVARGKPPVRGRDAVVTYNELLQTPAGYPLMKEDGTVDFFELNLIRNVTPGAVLAYREPATKGTPGMNVQNANIPPIDGKEQILKAGKGCCVTDDGLQVIAQVSGHAVLNYDGRIVVSPVFEVRGDVGTSTGNIDFVGTVLVRGSVSSGFTVRAEQNVEVHGGIDGGIVEAGGDVIVMYGIQGAGRGHVHAGGLIKCRFMENAEVRAGRDVTVSDGILHSRVRCGGKVTVTGRRGSIIGGSIRAKEEVSTRVIGSNLATMTEVEVGISPETRDELEYVRRTLVKAEEGLRKSQQAVILLRDLEAKNPKEFSKEKRDMLMKSLRSQYYFQGQRDQMAIRRAALEEELQQSYLGRVRAYDYVYPGVKVMIGNEGYMVIDVLQRTSFYLSEQREVTLGTT